MMKNKNPNKLIVSLDVQSLNDSLQLIDTLSPIVDTFKVGAIPFFNHGHALLKRLEALNKKAFLDLKWHDIPNTVKGAVIAASQHPSVFMMNVHCLGGEAMLKAAVEGVEQFSLRPLLIGVTVLTSLAEKDLKQIGMSANISEQALKLATLAKNAGLNGVVASAHEAVSMKKNFGQAFLVVTPGIRPAWSVKKDDQARIVTPKDALKLGADYLVVGRPIIANENPFKAAQRILEEMDNND